MRSKIWTGIGIVALTAIFVSCKAGVGGSLSRHNDEIDVKTREAIHQLNDRLVDSIRQNDPAVMIAFLADEVKKQPGYEEKIKNVYAKMSPLIQGKTITAENDYEIVSQSAGSLTSVIPSETTDKFTMTVEGVSPRMFVSLLVVPDVAQDFQISLIYVQVKKEWKMLVFYGGVVRIAGKTAIGWFKEVNELFEKGALISASLRLQIIQACLRPAPFMQYENEKEMIQFERKLQAAVLEQYHFPMALNSVEGSPVVFSFEPQLMDNQVIPIILYLSKIPIGQGQDLQNEANAITAELGSLFKGLTDGITKVYYRAFSEFPAEAAKQYPYFGMEVDLKDLQKEGSLATAQ